MKLAATLALLQLAAPARQVLPVLELPEAGLDHPAAYEGFRTRFLKDASGNAVQIYLDQRDGRVVHVWADAFNESLAFSLLRPDGRPARVAWASAGGAIDAEGRTRSLEYVLATEPSVEIGHLLLGSMRWERDLQYQDGHRRPLTAEPFRLPELVGLVTRLERLEPAERRAHLALLGAGSVAELRARLEPRLTVRRGAREWTLRAEQPSLDGRNHLALELRGDAGASTIELDGRVLRVRSRDGGPVHLTVRVETDAPPLAPLERREIFNRAFLAFHDSIRAADPASPRFRRLERQVRSLELLSYREKLLAGLPNFATYFGRDMIMTALMMQPVWSDAMTEHVIGGVLRKLSPSGQVSHEEALGGQAIREHAAEYADLLDRAARLRAEGSAAAADSVVARARAVLTDLQAVREDYRMLDDDFQFPVLVAGYLAAPGIPAERKRAFLLGPVHEAGGETRLEALLRNLAYVARASEAYAREPDARNLIAFPRLDGGRYFPGSWRDSGAGYANGRFAMDINVVWVPAALASTGGILASLRELGFDGAALQARAPGLAGSPLGAYIREPAVLRSALDAWQGAERHFVFRIPATEAQERIRARLARLPAEESRYWAARLAEDPPPPAGLEFLALALDSLGRPLPVMNTDPAMRLFLAGPGSAHDALGRSRVLRDIRAFVQPYPVGLFVEELGPLVANDAYASPEVWERFRSDRYHSPWVVWGREVNLFVLGLLRRLRLAEHDAAPGAAAYREELAGALRKTLAAVDASDLKYTELWTYRIQDGRLVPVRYPTGSDLQLWSLSDVAVQFELARTPPKTLDR